LQPFVGILRRSRCGREFGVIAFLSEGYLSVFFFALGAADGWLRFSGPPIADGRGFFGYTLSFSYSSLSISLFLTPHIVLPVWSLSNCAAYRVSVSFERSPPLYCFLICGPIFSFSFSRSTTLAFVAWFSSLHSSPVLAIISLPPPFFLRSRYPLLFANSAPDTPRIFLCSQLSDLFHLARNAKAIACFVDFLKASPCLPELSPPLSSGCKCFFLCCYPWCFQHLRLIHRSPLAPLWLMPLLPLRPSPLRHALQTPFRS